MAKTVKQTPEEPEDNNESVSIEWISQQQAKEMLEASRFNRLIKERRVAEYKLAMFEGRWMFTGESVIFNGGELVDGYHRLRALSETTSPQKFVVVRGVDKQAFHYIDKGASRTFADTLHVSGNENEKIVSSAVSYLCGYIKHGRFTPYGNKEYERWKVYEEYPEVNTFQAFYNRSLGLRYVPSGLLVAIHVVLHHKDADAADDYMEAMVGEVNDLPDGHPAPAFQAYVHKHAALDKKPKGYEVKIGSGFLDSWNKWRQGIAVTKFRTPAITPEPI